MKYSITRALAELKLLKDRVNKEIYNSPDAFVAVKHGKKLRSPYTAYKQEDFENKAKSHYQSVCALIKRLDEIKSAINKSNFETKVKIGSKEMTVLEALIEKDNIQYKRNLLNIMKQQLLGAKREIELAETENRKKVETQVHDQVTSAMDASKKKDIESEVTESIEKLYSIDLIDPLTLEDKIKELETEIEEFDKNVDFVLSESNSTTFIEISD